MAELSRNFQILKQGVRLTKTSEKGAVKKFIRLILGTAPREENSFTLRISTITQDSWRFII